MSKKGDKNKIKVKDKWLLFDDHENKEFLTFVEAIIDEVFDETKEEEEDETPLYEGWLDEASYPEGFSLQDFKSQKSFKARIEYIKKHLGKHLGQGSSRIVFPVGDDSVIKIAKNPKGIAQNEIEADVHRMGYEYIAAIKDYDEENYLFIEMERARKMKKSDWKKITGYDFDIWNMVLTNYMNRNRGIRMSAYIVDNEVAKEIQDTELFNDVITMLADFNMPTADIGKVNSWGLVDRDGKTIPVLIDYGLTIDVYTTHYRR